MPKLSAGLLLFRLHDKNVQVFLVHPGGPFWRKDLGSWTIPKGEAAPGEDLLVAAQREFQEETGIIPTGDFQSLGEIKQPGGKIVSAWAVEQDCSAEIRSNTFSLEWPPKSGRMQEFPEVDRAAWFTLEEANVRIHPAQAIFLTRIQTLLSSQI